MNIQTNEQGLTFQQWFDEANTACESLCGLGLDDLADGPSYDSWESGMSPREYAEEILEEEGFPFE